MLQQYYYTIIVKENDELAEISIIDEDKYNYFASIFDYVYHTKNGDTYQLHENFDAGIDMLIVDDKHLYALLDDLITQGLLSDYVYVDFDH